MESRQVRRRAEVIHRRKLFGGTQTAQEVHAKHAFPPHAKCVGCGSKGRLQTRFITLVPLDEMRKRDPMVDALMQQDPAAFLKMIVPIKGGDGTPLPFLRVSTVYACGPCTPTAERAAAKAPSWAIVEINRGPGADKIVSGPVAFAE